MSKLESLIAEVVVNPKVRMKLLRWTNYFIKRKPLLLRGFFGAGKTRLANNVSKYIYYKVHNDKQFRVKNGPIVPIIALPLRKLRDQVFDTYYDDEIAFKFKAHDEVCESLRKRIKEERDYWRALAKHLKEDECLYKQHVRELIDAVKKEKVIVTTHSLAPIVDMISRVFRRKPLVIFDEGEDFLERISQGIDGTVVEAMKEIDVKLYKRFSKVFVKAQTKYFYREELLRQLLRDVIILSATFPRTIVLSYGFLCGRELDETWVYTKSKEKEKDVGVFYTGKLLWKKYDEWKRTLYPQLVELVRLGTERYGVVGIVSRNYTMTRDIQNMVSEIGYEVTSDLDKDFKSRLPNADVVIVTVKGKLYRGINILKGLDDVKMVLAFYQGSETKEHHPFITDTLQKFGDGTRDLYPDYVKEMKMAKNLQAVYRFVRKHENRHIIVFFDWRFHEAFYHFFRNRLYESMLQVQIDDLTRIVDVVKQYI